MICSDCGDDNGPYERQPDKVQQLRGPYADADSAKVAAIRHTVET